MSELQRALTAIGWMWIAVAVIGLAIEAVSVWRDNIRTGAMGGVVLGVGAGGLMCVIMVRELTRGPR